MFDNKIILLLFLVVLSSVGSQHPRNINVNTKLNFRGYRELLKRIKGADIKSWLNVKVKPCKNFYDFACGNWKRIHASRVEVEGSISRYGELSAEMERRAKRFIENLNAKDAIHRKIYDFYESCRNTYKNRAKYIEALLEIAGEFGRFSFLKVNNEGNSSKSDFNWWVVSANMFKRFGKSLLIDIYTGYHFKDRNQTMIFMEQPSSLSFEDKMDDIRMYAINLFGANPKDIDQQIQDMYAFHYELKATTTKFQGDFVEEQFSLQTVANLTMQYRDLFDMESFLRIAFNLTDLPEQIYFENCEYFNEVQKVLNATKPATVEDYLLWQLIPDFVVDDSVENIDSVCVGKIQFYFVQYMEYVLYQEFRSTDYEMELYNLWHQIKDVFRDDLQSESKYQWMSHTIRAEAIRKLNNIKLKINSFDDFNFEKFFKDLHINPNNYAANLCNIMELFEEWRGSQLQIRTDSFEDINLAAFTPIYSYENNTVTLPVSTFLPFRVWHPAYPKCILYSDLGSSLAHELIHAFDDSNRQYDAQGNAIMWWDSISLKAYNQKRRCFQAQYSRYILKGHRVRNMTDQSENISDNAAIRISYTAYEKWWSKNNTHGAGATVSEVFNNLPYSREELFFINFGQSFCEAASQDILMDVMLEDTHAPDVLRALVPLSNYEKFSEIFKCNLNTPMNPKNKCKLY